MAIDYTKRPKSTPPEPPSPEPASGPSWYRRPTDDEATPPSAPSSAAPQPPAAPPPAPSASGPSWYRQPGTEEPLPPTAAVPPPGSFPPPAAAAPPAFPPPTAPPSAPAAPAAFPPPAFPPPTSQAFAPPAAPVPTPPAAPGVSLSKVTLSKQAPSVSLSKSGGGSGVIRVNLNWTAAAKSGGFLRRLAGGGAVDLDLGCLYELADGTKGVVQALGNAFGSLHAPPFIQLDGDDRTGSVVGGENMSINLAPGRFRRILIFAFIYEGVPNWAAADAVVTLTPVQGPQVEVRLDATSGQARSCAIAQLIDREGDLVVQREVQYINGGQSKIDAAYGWGMDWSPGRK